MADSLIHINILGGGNVATHLVREFAKHKGVKIGQIYNRTLGKIVDLERFATITDDIEQLQPADIFILAVTDDAVADLSKKIKKTDALVIHTSGSTAMESLATTRKGVWYPFQTFSKDKTALDFTNIPILIEAGNQRDLSLLQDLGNMVSQNVLAVNSEQRQGLHIAGVFVSNFVNHLYFQADNLLKNNDLSFDLLKPLINEVAQKVMTISPEAAQTGPAIRKDMQTIQKHLAFIKDPNQRKIYKLLTDSIINKKKKPDEK